MIVCSMNIIWTYYIHHIVIIMWPTSSSYVASLPFINPLPWPHGIVKCSSHTTESHWKK